MKVCICLRNMRHKLLSATYSVRLSRNCHDLPGQKHVLDVVAPSKYHLIENYVIPAKVLEYLRKKNVFSATSSVPEIVKDFYLR